MTLYFRPDASIAIHDQKHGEDLKEIQPGEVNLSSFLNPDLLSTTIFEGVHVNVRLSSNNQLGPGSIEDSRVIIETTGPDGRIIDRITGIDDTETTVQYNGMPLGVVLNTSQRHGVEGDGWY